MGNKFSVARLRKLMENGSVPVIVTNTQTTINDTYEHNSVHLGTTTFEGNVQFNGTVSGLTISGSVTSASYATTASYSLNSSTALTASSLSGFNQNNYVLVTDFNNYTSSVGTGSSSIYSGASNSINVGPIYASGSTQANATVLPTGSYIYRCTSDANTKGVILTSGHSAHLGMTFIIINDDATNHTFNIYPPTNGKINDGAVNAALLLDRGRSVMLVCFETGSSPKWGAVGY